ncbi:hypothetical protein Bca4012_019788 [Brassica carinata]
MASLHVSRLVLSSSSSSCMRPKAAVSIPKLPKFNVSVPKIPTKKQTLSVKEPSFELDGFRESLPLPLKQRRDSDSIQRARLNAVLEEVMDRIEMHKNIGDQRNNWNSLLLSSVNMITLTAALMAGLASVNGHGGDSVTAVKIASTVLLTSATSISALMSKIQPSQLAEEQRNATRLFKKLRTELEMFLTENEAIYEEDVKEAIQRVLALDKAYPLPLIGTMLEKFPEEFKPATWWPEKKKRNPKTGLGNGWSQELEMEMREVAHVVKTRDAEEYEKLGNVALKLNRFLAISGPVLTGVSAVKANEFASKLF